MQIYASTTFHGHQASTELARVLRLLGDLPLDGIELGSTHVWQGDLADTVTSYCGKPILTHNYFPPAESDLVLNIASDNPAIRDRSIAHMKHCIGFAGQIGAALYTIHPGFLSEPVARDGDAVNRTFDFKFNGARTQHDRAFELMVKALEELVQAARAAGIRLAIETEGSLTSANVTLMERPEEYDRLFDRIPAGLEINLNLAHTALAAAGHGFGMAGFIANIRHRIAAVEISHNDGFRDQHKPLEPEAPVLRWLPHLPDVPLILEFRHCGAEDIRQSAKILRAYDHQTLEARPV